MNSQQSAAGDNPRCPVPAPANSRAGEAKAEVVTGISRKEQPPRTTSLLLLTATAGALDCFRFIYLPSRLPRLTLRRQQKLSASISRELARRGQARGAVFLGEQLPAPSPCTLATKVMLKL